MINSLVGIGMALLVSWLLLVLALLLGRPAGSVLREGLRLLPDVLRLLRRLATDKTLPWGVRVRLWLLFGYLALPIDLIPDFLPVIGYFDDVIIVIMALRSVARRTGLQAIGHHWPGSDAGLAGLAKLANLNFSQYEVDELGDRQTLDDDRLR